MAHENKHKLPKESKKLWSQRTNQLYFDETQDEELIAMMTQQLPPMPAGYRLPPLIEILTPRQKFEVLSWFVDDMPTAEHFLFALKQEQDNSIWDFFSRTWPSMNPSARAYSLFNVIDKHSGNIEPPTDQTVPRSIFKDIIRGDKLWVSLLSQKDGKNNQSDGVVLRSRSKVHNFAFQR